MGERQSPRDVFDVWLFLNVLHAGINENIIRERTDKSAAEYAAWCTQRVKETSPKLLMQGLGAFSPQPSVNPSDKLTV